MAQITTNTSCPIVQVDSECIWTLQAPLDMEYELGAQLDNELSCP